LRVSRSKFCLQKLIAVFNCDGINTIGGKGVKTISLTDKTGKLVAIKNVVDSDDLMIINKSGIAIRMAVDSLRVMGRATQGVRLIKVREDDSIAAVAKVMKEDDPELDESLEDADSQITPVDVTGAEPATEQTNTEEE